jgi:purine catabolism regulator
MEMNSTKVLQNIAEVADAVNSSNDLDTILDRIVYVVCRHSAWSMSSIMSVDESSGHSVQMVRFDPYIADPGGAPHMWSLEVSPTRKVVQTNAPVVILDAQNAAEYPDYQEDARNRHYHTVVILPLHAVDTHGRPMVLAVQSREKQIVIEQELVFLQTICHLASIAMKKAHKLREERLFAERLEYSVRSASELMKLVLSQDTAKSVVQAIEEQLGQPAAIIDLTGFYVIAGRSPVPARLDNSQWAHHLSHSLARDLISIAHKADSNGFSPKSILSIQAGIADTGLPVLCEPLFIDGNRVGALILFTQNWKPDRVDMLLADQASFAASVLLMRGFIKFKSLADTQQSVMQQVIAGEWFSDEEVLARALRAGLSLNQPCRLLAVGAAALPDANQSREQKLTLHRAISQSVSQAFPGAACVLASENAYMVLVPDTLDPKLYRAQALNNWAGRLTSIVAQTIIVYAGGACSSLADYRAAWLDCEKILGLAVRFGHAGVVQAEEFGLYALLLSETSPEALEKFVADRLGKIEQYDAKYKSDLIATLEAYLKLSCRYQACADSLSIHVSTLRYRLDRLAELFGLDLGNPGQRFELEFALQLRRLRRIAPRAPS